MELTNWQIEKIRVALRAYRQFTPSHERFHLTWAEIAGHIEALTEVFMPAESLRQFVEGVSQKGEPERARILKPERLRAVVAFLTDPEIDALSKDELEEDRFTYAAPLRLSEFFAQDMDSDAPKPPPKIDGMFRAVGREDGKITTLDLVLRTDKENGVIRSGMTRDIYAVTGNLAFEDWDEAQKRKNRRSRKESLGWAVITPEDNLLVFLKDQPFPVHHYLSLAAEIDLWTDEPVTKLVVLRQDYPPELQLGHGLTSLAIVQARDQLAEQLAVFHRMSG